MAVTGARSARSPALIAIKVVHTVVWAFFVACILAIPAFALRGEFRASAVAAGFVLVEVGVLALNRFVCPLTDVAACHTDDRAPNFDIYLPLWLAKYNKEIFGPLYFVALVFALLLWRQATS